MQNVSNTFYVYVYIMLFNHKAKNAKGIYFNRVRIDHRTGCEMGSVCIFVTLLVFRCLEIWLHAKSAFIVAPPHLGPDHMVEVVCVTPNCCLSPESHCLLKGF